MLPGDDLDQKREVLATRRNAAAARNSPAAAAAAAAAAEAAGYGIVKTRRERAVVSNGTGIADRGRDG